jgi:iron complex outermembrane receptor protein
LLSALALTAGAAAEAAGNDALSLADLSIEQLMNESVTSVSKKETRLADSPAAITVITPEDIRRTGATTVPEALRIVPGLDVARINANEWAVSSRGFNSQYGNKLLVLVDGRSVYTPSFSGVYWNMQDLMLEDLDRIEVIRGPGATLWGANAVNGVINIMSKSAQDTQGFLANVAYGTDLRPMTSLRYGGQAGTNLFYRVYGQFLNHDNFLRADGTEAGDPWQSERAGLRLDWQPAEQSQFTLQGDYNNQRIDQTFSEARLTPVAGNFTDTVENHNQSGNVLGRWTRRFEGGSESSLQVYYDTFKHFDSESSEQRSTIDVDWQHRLALGRRNEAVWGLGYRYTADNIAPSETAVFRPQRTHHQVFSGFLQDEFKLAPDRLSLTLGSKFEQNDYTGFEIQPSARLLWTPTHHHSVWASVSRAVRTPSRFESDGHINLQAFQPPSSPPVLVALLPSSNPQSEKLIAYELGYRVEPTRRLAFDLAGFYNTYSDRSVFIAGASQFDPAPPTPHILSPVEGSNSGDGVTYGGELQAQWHVNDRWRLTGGYTWLHMRLHPDEATERDNPQHQFNLRSYLDLTRSLEWNSAAYYVDQTSHLSGSTVLPTPSYFRFDTGVTWRPTQNLELSVWGQNLLDGRHAEFNSFHASFLTEVPRSVLGKITWRF